MPADDVSAKAALPPRPAMVVLTVVVPFGCGYYLSYLFRTVNAIISPHTSGRGTAFLVMLALQIAAFAWFVWPRGSTAKPDA